MSSRLPSDVQALIRRHIHSVGELELLLLLRADPDRRWSLAEICDELGCPPSWALAQLEAQTAAGLVELNGGDWRFAPASRELDATTEALAEAHRRRPGEVARFVFAATRPSFG